MCFTIEDALFSLGPWKDLGSHKYTLGSRKRPWEDLGASNWVPKPTWRRGLPDFAGSGGAFGWGGGGARPRAHLGPGGGRSWGGGVAGEGARRRPAVAAAVAYTPAGRRRFLGNEQVLEL
jgi:hypothetical protein